MTFRSREQAGRVLAERLTYLTGENPVVVGIAAGGVVVAHEVAEALCAPLDVLAVRKLPVPGYPLEAMGVVGEGGVLVSDHDVLDRRRITGESLAAAAHDMRPLVVRQAARYRRALPGTDVAGRFVVLVDDGAVSGTTARAAIRVLRSRGAYRIVLAVPVAPRPVLQRLADTADQVVCPLPAHWAGSLHPWYRELPRLDDDVVVAVLKEHDEFAAYADEAQEAS